MPSENEAAFSLTGKIRTVCRTPQVHLAQIKYVIKENTLETRVRSGVAGLPNTNFVSSLGLVCSLKKWVVFAHPLKNSGIQIL